MGFFGVAGTLPGYTDVEAVMVFASRSESHQGQHHANDDQERPEPEDPIHGLSEDQHGGERRGDITQSRERHQGGQRHGLKQHGPNAYRDQHEGNTGGTEQQVAGTQPAHRRQFEGDLPGAAAQHGHKEQRYCGDRHDFIPRGTSGWWSGWLRRRRR